MTLSRILPLIALLCACKGDEPEPKASDSGAGGADTGGGDGSDGADGTDGGGGEVITDGTGYPDGDYILGFSIAAVSGVQVAFQAQVDSVLVDGQPAFASFAMRGSDGVDAVSDVLVEIQDVPIDPETGAFTVELPLFTLPAEYAPTGSAVDIQATLSGTATGEDAFCGDVSGEVVTFELDLAGSTFGARPWDQRGEGLPLECGASDGPLPRLEAADCPAITEGVNSGFSSGGESRSFELILPDGYDPSASYPLVFVYHGFGGTAEDMVNYFGFGDAASSAGVIGLAPQGLSPTGTTAFDVFNHADINVDITLFDDLVTCVSSQYSVDPDRIHSTGMSNGGLMTGALVAQRSDVLASAAPFSGGFLSDFSDVWQPDPLLVTWGGEIDLAYDVDFHDLALEMMELADANGSFVVACNHNTGHELDGDWWSWSLKFLVEHPGDLSTEPYESGLPEGFPEWCTVYGSGD
jgi:predicted esterase